MFVELDNNEETGGSMDYYPANILFVQSQQ